MKLSESYKALRRLRWVADRMPFEEKLEFSAGLREAADRIEKELVPGQPIAVEAPAEKRMLTRKEAADLLGLTPGTLGIWTMQGRGPVYTRLGRSIRYLRKDLEAYINKGRVKTQEPERENRALHKPPKCDPDRYLTIRVRKFRERIRTNPPKAVSRKDVKALATEFELSPSTVRKHLKVLGVHVEPIYSYIHKDNLKTFVSVDAATKCWELPGVPLNNGYAKFGRHALARNVIFQWFKGKVPAECVLANTCQNRKCVNPAHLCPKTRSTLRQEEAAKEKVAS